MKRERKADLFDEMLMFARSAFSDYDLYEWGRGHDLTSKEMQEEFNFTKEQIKEYKTQYKEDYDE